MSAKDIRIMEEMLGIGKEPSMESERLQKVLEDADVDQAVIDELVANHDRLEHANAVLRDRAEDLERELATTSSNNKYVVITEHSAGNETIGEMWKETAIFNGAATLDDVMKHAMGTSQLAHSRRQITLTKPHDLQK